jgi:hypothetical protein
MIRNVCLSIVVVVGLLAPTQADAQFPYLGYPGYGSYGWGWGFNQATNYVPAPPYYSLYPPVYYAPFITARHYGASPFAWSAGMEPITYVPDVTPAAGPDPVIIENPFVAGPKNTGAKATKIEAKPLKLSNPFVLSMHR